MRASDALRRRAAAPAPWILAGLVLAGCAGSPPRDPSGPEAVALGLFELAGADDPDPEELARRFVLSPEGPTADLLDALSGFRPARRPRLRAAHPLGDPGRVHLELTADLAGGGEALYHVQLERSDGATWRVRWFQGPGFEWPRARRPRDDGLRTSPPPR